MRPVTLRVSGSGGPAESPICPPDLYTSPFQITLQTVVTGTVDYTVRYTKQDPFDPSFSPAAAEWTSVDGMTAEAANAEATLISPVRGIQLILNSGDGSVDLIILQAGK